MVDLHQGRFLFLDLSSLMNYLEDLFYILSTSHKFYGLEESQFNNYVKYTRTIISSANSLITKSKKLRHMNQGSHTEGSGELGRIVRRFLTLESWLPVTWALISVIGEMRELLGTYSVTLTRPLCAHYGCNVAFFKAINSDICSAYIIPYFLSHSLNLWIPN